MGLDNHLLNETNKIDFYGHAFTSLKMDQSLDFGCADSNAQFATTLNNQTI
jgi:hypothetical protein